MALHTDLPIYRTGVRLLDLAVKVQVQMPRTGSLAERAIAFFRANPEEELTPADMAAKFHREYGSVDQSLRGAICAGLLAKVKRDDGTVVYRLPDLITETEAA